MDYWIIQWFYRVISLWCSQGTKSVRLLCTAMMKGVVHRWPWSRWFTFAPPGIAVTSLGRVWKDHRFVYLSYIAVRYQPHHWRGKTHIRNAILTSYNFNHFTLHAPTRQMPHMIPKKNSKTGCREPPPTLLRPIACHLIWKMVICCSSPKAPPGKWQGIPPSFRRGGWQSFPWVNGTCGTGMLVVGNGRVNNYTLVQ